MKAFVLAVIGMLAATCVSAQTAPAPVVPAASAPVLFPVPPTDPVRLAAARPVIDRVWPLGTYSRIMHAVMEQMVQGTMTRMFAMRPDELAAMVGMPAGTMPLRAGKDAASPASGETLGQLAAKDDPYFRQRIDLTMRAVTDETARLMTEVEPSVRDALAHSYARRFTVAELRDLDRFFATPTGAGYARDSTMMMMSPDMMAAMQAFVPRMIQEMPAIMAKVTDATKSLPVPPAKKKP